METILIENTDLEIEEKIIKIDDKEIAVKQYLETWKKSDIMETINLFSFQDSLIDRPRLDALFNALVVLNYTNIRFEYKKEEELMAFYDYMEANGYMAPIILAIPSVEYEALVGYLKKMVKDFDRFKTSSAVGVTSMVEAIPELMENIGKISKEIDIDTISELVKISKLLG